MKYVVIFILSAVVVIFLMHVIRIIHACVTCKHMLDGSNEYPCNVCSPTSKFDCMWEPKVNKKK